jgi:Bax protein
MSFKNMYVFTALVVLFTGCTDSSKKEEIVVKKEVVIKPQMSVSVKKKRFKDTLVPIATEVYNKLELQYLAIKLDIDNLKKYYNAKTDQKLLYALKPHPISILLAQAAAESAWLTSRFTKDANNIFGVWSFNKNEPRIAASGMRGDKTIYLKKYKTLKEAVEDYYKNLGKTWAYSEFRKQRTLTNNPYILSDYLTSYSEKKVVYTELLKSMIKYNKFDIYDIPGKINEPVKIEEKVAVEEKKDEQKVKLIEKPKEIVDEKKIQLEKNVEGENN